MQDTTSIANWAEIIASGNYSVQWAIDIGEVGRLIDTDGAYLNFGDDSDPVRILISSAGADYGFGEDYLKSLTITKSMFSGSPELGKCVSSEIDVEMLMPEMIIPRMSAIRAFNRIFNDELTSGWVNQGTFFTDTREQTRNIYGQDTIKLHGYDVMLQTEQAYTWGLTAGATDIEVVNDIAAQLQIEVDSRTTDIMTRGFTIDAEQVGQYTMREILGWLAGAYAGSFIITPLNELRLVQLTTPPPETSYLSVYEGNTVYHLLFGEDRILV